MTYNPVSETIRDSYQAFLRGLETALNILGFPSSKQYELSPMRVPSQIPPYKTENPELGDLLNSLILSHKNRKGKSQRRKYLSEKQGGSNGEAHVPRNNQRRHGRREKIQ